jgi:hypothetical protein
VTAYSATPALDHEAALLGALLQHPASALTIDVRAEHYARPLHATIHEAIVTAAETHGDDAGLLHVVDILRQRRDVPNLMPLLRNGTVLMDYVAATQGTAGWHSEKIIDAWRRRQLREVGTRLRQIGDQVPEFDTYVETAVASVIEALDYTGGPKWDPPTPLSARRALPAFPVDALPGWVADQVAAVAEFTQTPPDLAGCIALAALSTAAGGRAIVEIRPGWREPLNIFTAVAMPPGSRKSAVFAAMTAPLLEAERQLVDRTRPQLIEADLARRTAQRDAERYATNAANSTNPQARAEALAMATDAALAADTMTVPALPRLIADDVTPEAAASLLAEQGGRLAVLSAEGGIFGTLAGRYAGGMPSLEVFLKGHAGDLLRVDRKGRPAEHIPRPALTLGLALQPDVLRDIAHIAGFRGRGLLARILYSLPENTVGHRRIGAPVVPPQVKAVYGRHLRSLVLTLAGRSEPAILALTAAADTRMLALEAALEPRLAEHGELGHIADWASKLNGAIARLAGLLHLAIHLRDGWAVPIGTSAVDNAAALGDYYLTHALAVFDHMGADPTVEDARAILDWMNRCNRSRFTRRELFRGVSSTRFRKVTDLDRPLNLLEQHDYIRRGAAPPPTGGRPAAPPYDVNPHTAEPAHIWQA